MKKSDLLRIKQIIMDSKDYLSFKKALNLDNNSLFLCLLDILQEAIVDYNPINDYEYLTKAVLYLKSIYLELSKAKRDYYKKDINSEAIKEFRNNTKNDFSSFLYSINILNEGLRLMRLEQPCKLW